MSLVIELVNHHHHSHFSSRRTDSAGGLCSVIVLQASAGSQRAYCNSNVFNSFTARGYNCKISSRLMTCIS